MIKGRPKYFNHLIVDASEPVSTIPALEAKVVVIEAQQSHAASGPQHPLGLRQEALRLEPVSSGRRRQQVHGAVRKWQLLCGAKP